MATVQGLPNGYLIVTLTPREAVWVESQILDPGDFPWQSSEAQIVAMEVKMQLRKQLQRLHRAELSLVSKIATEALNRPSEKEQLMGELLREIGAGKLPGPLAAVKARKLMAQLQPEQDEPEEVELDE